MRKIKNAALIGTIALGATLLTGVVNTYIELSDNQYSTMYHNLQQIDGNKYTYRTKAYDTTLLN